MTVDAPFVVLRDDLAGREMLFSRPISVVTATKLDQVVPALKRMQAASKAGKWTAGFFAYEAGFAFEPKLARELPANRRVPLASFGIFEAPVERPVRLGMPGDACLSDARALWSFDDYLPRFERLHDHLRRGDCYQANLTFPVSARWRGDPAEIFDSMTGRQPVRYAAHVELEGPAIVSRSPELFFQITGDRWIETHPMKGTARRGQTPEEDLALAEFLANDPKNQAENRMIVDLLRNDISRICEIGTLSVPKLFQIETYPTVHQMVSHVRARLRADASLVEIFEALFPCGSITGAPKLRAMQILRQLEDRPRDIYCGAIGFTAPDGSMRFNVAIRTITLHEHGEAVLNVGGGIVFDSDARAEYEECLLKARFATGSVPTTG
jgi:para-aminobenzoate synthetase component 1